MRVGVPQWVPAEFAFVARDLGFFDEKDIELVPYGSPIELSRHLREGSLDAAALSLDFVPYWAGSIPSLDVVFVIDVSQGANAVVAIPKVHDLAELRGRRVGVEASPLGAHMLLRALKAGGLLAREVEAVSVDSEDQADAFRSGSVDAVVTCEPDLTRLLSSGASLLFDSAQLPGQIVDVLVVPSATAGKRKEALRALVAGWMAAFARLDGDHAATVARLASGLSVDVATIERAVAGVRLGSLEINQKMLGGPSPALASTLADIESLAAGAGLLNGGRRGRVRFDNSFLPASRPDGWLSGAGAR